MRQDLVLDLLEAHLAPQWEVARGVRVPALPGDDVELVHYRIADALARKTTGRGVRLQGFEVKCTRADLLVELASPTKSASVRRWCERWWLVVAEPGLIRPGELPAEWGALTVNPDQDGIEVLKDAPKSAPLSLSRHKDVAAAIQTGFTPSPELLRAAAANRVWRKGNPSYGRSATALFDRSGGPQERGAPKAKQLPPVRVTPEFAQLVADYGNANNMNTSDAVRSLLTTSLATWSTSDLHPEQPEPLGGLVSVALPPSSALGDPAHPYAAGDTTDGLEGDEVEAQEG